MEKGFFFPIGIIILVTGSLGIPMEGPEYENWCGCAAIQYSMKYYGINKTQSEICKPLGMVPESKSLSLSKVYSYLHKEGMDVSLYRNNDFDWSIDRLRTHLDSGHIAILLHQLPQNQIKGHYSVFILTYEDDMFITKTPNFETLVSENEIKEMWEMNVAIKGFNQMIIVKGLRE